jgi:hypothetical protein
MSFLTSFSPCRQIRDSASIRQRQRHSLSFPIKQSSYQSTTLVHNIRRKTTQCKNIHKEMFPVYGGKCLSRKAVHNWVEKFSQEHLKVADDTRPGAEVAETTVKRLLCCRFRRTGKAMGRVYRCREINVFSMFEYHMFYVLHPSENCLLTLPRI